MQRTLLGCGAERGDKQFGGIWKWCWWWMGLVRNRIYPGFFGKEVVKLIPQKWLFNKTKISGKSNNSNFSQGLEQLAESNIIAARIDLGSSICTNILSVEAELQGYDMALTDDPHPRKKGKLEEQMATVQAEIHKLKAKLSRNVSTLPRSNTHQSPADRSEGSMWG